MSALNAAVNDPSAAGADSSIDSLSFSASRPPGVFIVGMTRSAHLGAAQHGDVAAVLDLLRLEAGVRREVVLDLEALHVRHVDDLQREDCRAHAIGLDEVLQRLRDVEDHAFVLALVIADERQRLEHGLPASGAPSARRPPPRSPAAAP